jgi:hypothetical protein
MLLDTLVCTVCAHTRNISSLPKVMLYPVHFATGNLDPEKDFLGGRGLFKTHE